MDFIYSYSHTDTCYPPMKKTEKNGQGLVIYHLTCSLLLGHDYQWHATFNFLISD